MRTLRTLCSGGELFGVGARAAGYAHVDGYEIDPKIAAVAQRNGFDVRAADVCEVPYETLPAVDHLHISPSCKNASQANQKGKDESGEPLPRETAGDLAVADASCRAIHAHQGATFTLENVWGYRSFESFDRIRAALADAGFSYEYWHLNSADYGVPQTRKRLILIARRGLWRIQRPHPTHRNGGDMFHARWRGWYAAIADIVHTLPPTKPAPWQLARLPKELTKTIIVHRNDMRSMPTRYADEPIFTITAGSFNSSHSPSTMHRAYIVGGGNTQLGQIDSYARPDDAPMFTVSASDGARKTAAAYLLDGDNARSDTGEPIMRAADEPAMAMRATRATVHRAHISGQWVRMTIQALGRFQTVPDSYQGLTSEINGNGVPCDFAEAIMRSL
jgi:site-specific DNA-cytosine methylase